MSGGAYDYAYSRLHCFIEEMKVESNGSDLGHENFALRSLFKQLLIAVAEAMKSIEWNDSCDGDADEAQKIRACFHVERAANEIETIDRAAIMLPKKRSDEPDVIVSVARPGRHHDIIRALARAGMDTPVRGEQGFTTSSMRFVDRVEGRIVAENAKQLLPRAGTSNLLFSEDAW